MPALCGHPEQSPALAQNLAVASSLAGQGLQLTAEEAQQPADTAGADVTCCMPQLTGLLCNVESLFSQLIAYLLDARKGFPPAMHGSAVSPSS